MYVEKKEELKLQKPEKAFSDMEIAALLDKKIAQFMFNLIGFKGSNIQIDRESLICCNKFDKDTAMLRFYMVLFYLERDSLKDVLEKWEILIKEIALLCFENSHLISNKEV
ncbi:MAG TPA: hypothetical protein VHO47_01005 [Candidatus Babeliales bacterium]|nr:hypothetical protein [Candidatus Babeliales bacterium]